jgi:hypothetical protein
MLDVATFGFFTDELAKLAAFSSGEKALAGLTLAGGTLLGAAGQDMRQDAREGRTYRKGREFEQRQQLATFKKGLQDG